MSRKALGRGLNALFNQVESLDQDLRELDVSQIEPNEAQPRHVFDDEKLKELVLSIKSNGIIQPIVVRKSGDTFQIVAGERRWRAAKLAGLQRVPCIIKEISDDNVLEVSLIENLQREELNPIEEAAAYKRLVEQLKLTHEEIARRIGKDRTSVANAIRLLKLPSEVQEMLESGRISMGHARAILAVESPKHQVSLAETVAARALSVREVEGIVQKGKGGKPRQQAAPNSTAVREQANISAAEAKLAKRLNAPVSINFKSRGGSIQIRFSSAADLSRLYDLLMQRGSK